MINQCHGFHCSQQTLIVTEGNLNHQGAEDTIIGSSKTQSGFKTIFRYDSNQLYSFYLALNVWFTLSNYDQYLYLS